MSKLGSLQNQLLPCVVHFLIMVGLGVAAIGLIITVYGIFKRKFSSVKDVLHYYCGTVVLGLLTSITGALISIISSIDINTSVYKKTLPPSIVIALIILVLCLLVTKPKNKE